MVRLMVREKPVEERVAQAEETVNELRSLVAEVRATLVRLESYESDLKWLRDERRKAR